MPRVNFVNLERGGGDALAEFAATAGAAATNFPAALDDMEELAALLTALERVVTVDNTVAAHLAGALGCETSIMLAHSADWRWVRTGAVSPWYPSVTLIRQRAPGDWTNVIAEVADGLRAVP